MLIISRIRKTSTGIRKDNQKTPNAKMAHKLELSDEKFKAAIIKCSRKQLQILLGVAWGGRKSECKEKIVIEKDFRNK